MNPRKPLLIYDGDCRFCCRWIERWKGLTGEAVEYEPSRTAAARFPEIPVEAYDTAVQFVRRDGSRVSGAEAVLEALAEAGAKQRMLRDFYREHAWFAGITETIYRFVARHRTAFSRATVWLWGADVRTPTYAFSSRIFLQLLGMVYLVAFWSYWVQADGLLGELGILPATQYFQTMHDAMGARAYWELPSVAWLGASAAALKGWCVAGMGVSLVLVIGFCPAFCLVFLWAVYLSLTVAGQAFYEFQWDALLLETGFLAIFLAPWALRLRTMRPPAMAHFLLIWLLFRLMFASGVVKLTSGDPSWWGGTALDYHYFTQPLPTSAAWYAQQMPEWSRWLSVKLLFVIELGLPFLLFAPRRLRLLAVAGLVLLQILIALTGNYGFFNLLTLLLCLLAVDDYKWGSWVRVVEGGRFMPRKPLAIMAVVLLTLSLVPLLSCFRVALPMPPVLVAAYEWTRPFESLNSYGLFAGMTKERREILVQYSDDGVAWKDYVFPYKPGELARRPGWMVPYMPRLDWQMWFAALGSAESSPWFQNFMVRLLQGSKPVVGLLAEPRPEHPPKYVRARSGYYTFTTKEERAKTGRWWKVEPGEEYFPAATLKGR